MSELVAPKIRPTTRAKLADFVAAISMISAILQQSFTTASRHRSYRFRRAQSPWREINMLTDRTRLRYTAPILALFAAVAVVTPVAGQTTGQVVIPVDKMEWKPGPPALYGVEVAVLLGNPAKEGPFIMRLKFPAGFEYLPHRHPGTEGHLTIISGAFGIGFGEKFDRSKAPLLPAGSFFVMPSTPHFAWTDRESILQVNGMGPWRVEFIKQDGAKK
jgi:hypothetical protein